MTRSSNDITSEITLFQIWRESQRIKKPVGNRIIRLLSFLLLAVYSVLPWSTTNSLILTARQLSAIGLPVVLGLLGFLLAGYTVFISIARRDLLLAMAERIDRRSGLSWLKVSMYTYVGALAELLIVASAFLVIVILGQSGGIVSHLVRLDSTGRARDILACIGFTVCGYCFVHTLVALKVTIRNVHHGIAAAIRWDAEDLKESPD